MRKEAVDDDENKKNKYKKIYDETECLSCLSFIQNKTYVAPPRRV